MTCSHGWASSAPCPLCALIAERDAAGAELLVAAKKLAEARAERDAWEATANHHYSEAFKLRALLAASVAVLRQWAPNEVDLIQRIDAAIDAFLGDKA